MKKIYFTMLLLFIAILGNTQNWSNVGNPYLSSGTTSSPYLYFGDMEIDASGNVFVGYWDYGGKCNVVKYNGTSWSALPSPGSFAVSFDDIEIHGTDIYFSYMGVRGTNLYAFVKKYDGSSSWNFIGDSILIGGTGQGGSFDFLIDNNGVPTIIGIQKAAFQEKTVKQFTSGAWATTYVIPNSAAIIFKDGSAAFDAANKLNCISGGYLTVSGPPYLRYYVTGLKIDGASSTVIADTVYAQPANTQFRIDKLGNSYLLFNNAIKPAHLSYKLNGSKWDMISDTVGATESMLYADVNSDGKVFFNTNAVTGMQKSMYSYNSGARTKMDTINFNGAAIGGISDVVVNNGYVYILMNEGNYSVMKHSVSGGSSGASEFVSNAESISFYPNPASESIKVESRLHSLLTFSLFDMNGRLVLEKTNAICPFSIDVSGLNQGVYLARLLTDSQMVLTEKIVVQK